MTSEEILEKALKKAIEYGFRLIPIAYKNIHDDIIIQFDNLPKDDCGFSIYYHIVFSHEFAKAFWGDYEICKCGGILRSINRESVYCESCLKREPSTTLSYLFHLQQMVLQEEPLKYIEKFLEGK